MFKLKPCRPLTSKPLPIKRWTITLSALMMLSAASASLAKDVLITPLGSHDGEFCKFDRALLFEDPDGTRLVYDVGRTVAGADDPRLGRIDGLLVVGGHRAYHALWKLRERRSEHPGLQVPIICMPTSIASVRHSLRLRPSQRGNQ